MLQRDTEPESMAELITKTCQEFKDKPKLWNDVSFQCRLFVEENYSWEKNVDFLEQLIARIAA
ncbi:MAG: hypothetical protein U9Q84_03040 [Thermodesulfobacteriota bacterium]|nr:hypothetical protein [Thermodesulfobacteriota bacterium]